MRTTVNLEETVLAGAKEYAGRHGVQVSAVIADALRAFLARESGAATPPFQLHTVSGKLVNPGVDLNRTSDLVVADDVESYRGDR